ncbi:DEAD/DEAH box helicase [Sphingomonas sp. BK345]|uniref:DEAD/DEAH box helicase n=1 Tax=Sphingomonas sp. BK345 TaxID=2586980 RepID=UPI00160B2DA3|nr:DEAD/DEAH box helicase [Sphingomonas sp. BK345]MBB3472751.1 superfamily II DNA or RNA helicase [Sphingomonas sp. BK345]
MGSGQPAVGSDGFEELAAFVADECERRLRAYEAQPRDANEHFETEVEVLSGGYAWRQLFELVQNAADAIGEAGHDAGRIQITLEADRIIAANTGAPLDRGGIVALLNARSSSKRAGQIGRFGIGFKSLLKLGGSVELVSRSVGLCFDPEWCRRTIRSRLGLGPDERAPGMRLARPVDPATTGGPLRQDGDYNWATTVVTALITEGQVRERLVKEMADFPAEFLLFLDADVELVLDVRDGPLRIITRRHEGDLLMVGDEQNETRWRIFQRRVSIADRAAIADALHLQARDEVPLAWAVPVGGREAAGQFWAFFPTQSQTLAEGILNAPWKLNSDRTGVIRGAWNEALMREAAKLIADHIGDLATLEDPGVPVAALPRQLERQDEIAASLVRPLWDLLAALPIVADGAGKLRRATDLLRHPTQDADLLRRWHEIAGELRAEAYVHPTCQTGRSRGARLATLAQEASRTPVPGRAGALIMTPAGRWLERAASARPEVAIPLLALVKEAVERRLLQLQDLRAAAIIPTVSGRLAAASSAIITSAGSAPSGLEAVAPAIASDAASRDVLTRVLGVREMAEDLWGDVLAGALSAAKTSGGDRWPAFWSNLAEAPAEAARAFLSTIVAGDLRFRDRTGAFRPREELVVPADDEVGEVPPHLALDSELHAAHATLLPEWLLSRLPPAGVSFGVELAGPAGKVIEAYFSRLRSLGWPRMKGSPQWGKTGVVRAQIITMPHGWKLLPFVPAGLAADLTAQCIEAMRRQAASVGLGEDSVFEPVTFGHLTRREAYDDFTAPHPFLAILAEHGQVRIGDVVVPLASAPMEVVHAIDAAGRGEGASIVAFRRAFEAPTDLDPLGRTKPGDPVQTAAIWKAAFMLVSCVQDRFERLGPMWVRAALDGAAPAVIPSRDGPVPLDQIFVSVDPGGELGASEDGRIVVLPKQAADVWIAAGARLLSEHTETFYDDALGTPGPLTGLFPELAPLFASSSAPDALWVFGLSERSGHQDRHPPVAQDATGVVLLDRERMKTFSWAAGMRALLDALHAFGLLGTDPALAHAALQSARATEARKRVRAEPTPALRILRAVGDDVAVIAATLPKPAARALGGCADRVTVAELALAIHGPTILSRLQQALAAAGLQPPERWGSEKSREFATELGFPPGYGSSASIRREPELLVARPSPLPDLHDYQKDILSSLRELVSGGEGRRRAVISLPTGGGKTRVAAEAVVRLILNGGGDRSALWVAQTDELCEQAVQCFRQLWSNLGNYGEDLRIARLWAGQPDPRPPTTDEPVVVVASIQTLNLRFDVRGLEWLSRPGIVVIDECHHAISPSYSSLLRWLDVQIGSETARDREPPVLGLSATPWRGRDEEESARLAARFDKRWIPADQAGLHDTLRQRGVLAEMRYSPIHYDRPVELNEAERRHFDQYGELPEHLIERIGADPERNNLILRHVLASSAHSILLFANSVAHAQYMAARLHLAGCPAAAVSGETDRLARQHFIRRFHDGELRVLCNHSVLTTGFDAPRSDMILISRPVFSAVRYMQMVGRGLRGPANGGTEYCEVATVEDNILTYRDRLAYHYCRQFFEVESERAAA